MGYFVLAQHGVNYLDAEANPQSRAEALGVPC